VKREVKGEGWKEFVCAIVEQGIHDLDFALTAPIGRKLDPKNYFTPLHFELFFDQVPNLCEAAGIRISAHAIEKKVREKIDKLRIIRNRRREKLCQNQPKQILNS
jgi:hypothetical protein